MFMATALMHFSSKLTNNRQRHVQLITYCIIENIKYSTNYASVITQALLW